MSSHYTCVYIGVLFYVHALVFRFELCVHEYSYGIAHTAS